MGMSTSNNLFRITDENNFPESFIAKCVIKEKAT